MKKKTVLWTNTVIFLIVIIFHLWRAITNNPLVIGNVELGAWVSWLAVIILAIVVYLNFQVLKD